MNGNDENEGRHRDRYATGVGSARSAWRMLKMSVHATRYARYGGGSSNVM